MNEFIEYLTLGFQHIIDIKGIDHMLFVIVLCAVYDFKGYKKILVLVTAFTVGHCLTLILSSFEILKINQNLVEFLIPVTILLTAIHNLIVKASADKKIALNYILAFGFGLIHGLGFSNFFKALMMGQDDLIIPLLSFNIGVELGQILIIVFIYALYWMYAVRLKKPHRDWNMVVSSAGAGMALLMIINSIHG